MKTVRVTWTKTLSCLVLVPDHIEAADVGGVAAELARKGGGRELDDWNPDGWEVDYVTPPVAVVGGMPQDDDLIVWSDDGEDFVNPHDAAWWKESP